MFHGVGNEFLMARPFVRRIHAVSVRARIPKIVQKIDEAIQCARGHFEMLRNGLLLGELHAGIEMSNTAEGDRAVQHPERDIAVSLHVMTDGSISLPTEYGYVMSQALNDIVGVLQVPIAFIFEAVEREIGPVIVTMLLGKMICNQGLQMLFDLDELDEEQRPNRLVEIIERIDLFKCGVANITLWSCACEEILLIAVDDVVVVILLHPIREESSVRDNQAATFQKFPLLPIGLENFVSHIFLPDRRVALT